MANFDFVESSSRSYKFFWESRAVIVRLAFIPVLIKLACFVAVTAFSDPENYLRQGLFLVPSYFAEGWLIAQLIRMAIFEESWPMIFTDDSKENQSLHESRMRSILAGTIIYVLTKLAAAFVAGYVMTQQVVMQTAGPGGTPRTPAEPGAVGFFLGTLILVFIIWSFRFLWLYVPAAMDRSAIDYLRRIKGFTSSFSLIGAWLLCFVPFAILLIVISSILSSVFPGSEDEVSAAYKYMIAGAQAVIEVCTASIAAVAVAYGVKSIYDGTNKPTPLL